MCLLVSLFGYVVAMQLPGKTAVPRHFIPNKARKKALVAGDIPLLKIPKKFDQFGKFGAVLARP